MLSPVSRAITFVAMFTASKAGKTGLTVTVDVGRAGTNSLVVTAGSATEMTNGLYKYTLASGSDATADLYYAVFKTSDSTVDAQNVPSLWVLDQDWPKRIMDGTAQTGDAYASLTSGVHVSAGGITSASFAGGILPTNFSIMGIGSDGSITLLGTNAIVAGSIAANAFNAKGDWNTTTPPTAAANGAAAATAILISPANKLSNDDNGYVTYNNAAPPTLAAIAAQITTDHGGGSYVMASDYQQRAVAVTLPATAPTGFILPATFGTGAVAAIQSGLATDVHVLAIPTTPLLTGDSRLAAIATGAASAATAATQASNAASDAATIKADYLQRTDSRLNALAAATGSCAITFTITGGGKPLAGVRVAMTRNGETKTGISDASGIVDMGRDPGTYLLVLGLSGWDYTPNTAFVVPALATLAQPLTMTALSITAPADPRQSTGTLFVGDGHGTGTAAKIAFRVKDIAEADGYSYPRLSWTAESDATGAFSDLFTRGGTYEGSRDNGPWIEFVVPDANGFTLPKILGAQR